MKLGTLLRDAESNIKFALTECANGDPEYALSYVTSALTQIRTVKVEIVKIKRLANRSESDET